MHHFLPAPRPRIRVEILAVMVRPTFSEKKRDYKTMDTPMEKATRTLRLAFIEHKVQGGLAGRDRSINYFLDVMGDVLTPWAIDNLPPRLLSDLFVNLLQSYQAGLPRKDMGQALLEDMTPTGVAFTLYHDQGSRYPYNEPEPLEGDATGKVVSLFSR
ncbi:hypothetical protein [Halomonas sp. DN3]|uniref:hypothetical protein n=1 Tax=Halomonas sp. DN3 TaxID=2953657 RepID=UPI00209F331D|nr:hypothetical protein [Halomonas sp. DN3]USZ49357.1 hypothetical protein NKF27_17995 [Halomonas sp. DN3]